MHYLLINQFFPPDGAPTAQLLEDVARALFDQGHRVTVVCGRARYAAAGPEVVAPFPVHRIRCTRFGQGRLARLLSYASFYLGALRHVVMGPRPDVVLTLTTPPLLSLAGTLARRLRGSAHVIWEMDLYPDVAVAAGTFRRGSLADRVVGRLADFSRCRANSNIVLGPCMRDRLAARGIPAAGIAVAENWVDSSIIRPQPFPEGPLTVLYAGNFGLAHDVDTIAHAIPRLDRSRFRFVFVGGGPRLAEMQDRCPEAVFLPYERRQELPARFAACHVGLVTQITAACGTLVPSKMYAYMAAGRPFVFIGPPGATPALIAARHGCGWRIDPGDVDSLLELLEQLAAQPELIHRAGARAHAVFSRSNDRHPGVTRILHILDGTFQAPGATTRASRRPENLPV